MKFQNWIRIGWWALVLILLSVFVYENRNDLLTGEASAFELIASVIWLLLLLAPIYSKVSFGGISLEQKIEEAKKEMIAAVNAMTVELRQNMSFQANINMQQGLAEPPPKDASLPAYQKIVDGAVAVVEEEWRLPASNDLGKSRSESAPYSRYAHREKFLNSPGEDEDLLDRDTAFLMSVRRKIEKEIAYRAVRNGINSNSTFNHLLAQLAAIGAIPEELVVPIRVIYSICSIAAHGDDYTPSQIDFVKTNQKSVIHALRELDD